MSEELHRDIGRHDAQIEALQDQVDKLHGEMKHMLTELQAINRTLSEARGGWKTLAAVAGMSGAVGVAFSKVMQLLGWH